MKTPWRWWRERQAKKARDKMRNGFYRTAESFRCLADAMAEVTKGYKSLNLIKMDNLLNSNGRRFRCKIGDTPVKGKIRVEGDRALAEPELTAQLYLGMLPATTPATNYTGWGTVSCLIRYPKRKRSSK